MDRLNDFASKLKADRLFVKYYNDPDRVLPKLGLRNEDVDYVSFDHLHVQDVRMIMDYGTLVVPQRGRR